MEDNLKKFEPKIFTNSASNEVIEALELFLSKAKSGNCEGMAMVFVERGTDGGITFIRTWESTKSRNMMAGCLFALMQRLTE